MYLNDIVDRRDVRQVYPYMLSANEAYVTICITLLVRRGTRVNPGPHAHDASTLPLSQRSVEMYNHVKFTNVGLQRRL